MIHNVIITTTDGYLKIDTKQIKYINIENRSICYHLIGGKNVESQRLRTSFEKSISNIIKTDTNFIYLKPSLIFNLNEIKKIDKYRVIFNDEEVFSFPKCKYDELLNAWLNFNSK